jgi:hypothetical protein
VRISGCLERGEAEEEREKHSDRNQRRAAGFRFPLRFTAVPVCIVDDPAKESECVGCLVVHYPTLSLQPIGTHDNDGSAGATMGLAPWPQKVAQGSREKGGI